jgi:hypothetical protein
MPRSRQGLPAVVDAQLSFLIRFLPLAQRSVQNDGLTLAYIR